MGVRRRGSAPNLIPRIKLKYVEMSAPASPSGNTLSFPPPFLYLIFVNVGCAKVNNLGLKTSISVHVWVNCGMGGVFETTYSTQHCGSLCFGTHGVL